MQKPLLVILLCFCCCLAYSRDGLCVMFYNVENYFDCADDPHKRDGDFLPDGKYNWTEKRFWEKTKHIAKVITVLGDGQFPDLIGMAEVENEEVVRCLTEKSALRKAKYQYVYSESPDIRGIDVCLLYNRFAFKVLNAEDILVHFPESPQKKTRNILYVKGQTARRENLHVFVCHWPSRYGGSKVSESLRCRAADILRAKVDSLFLRDENAKILIMGDMNDEPENISVKTHLGALPDTASCRPAQLYDLMWSRSQDRNQLKSHKYQNRWYMLDHLIVSTSLMYNPLQEKAEAGILQADFLLQEDSKKLGKKPFRTYSGYRYIGGYSDHLPVYMYLKTL